MSSEAQSCPEAIQRLRSLFNEARQRSNGDPSAASLATASASSARPSIRMVTVVTVDARGPIFFTDMRSGKGRQLSENPQAGLCFFWPDLHQQIVLEGSITTLDAAEADRYWTRKPHEARLAAWVEDTPVPEGEADTMDNRLRAVRRSFPDGPVQGPRIGTASAWSPIYVSSGSWAGAAYTCGNVSPVTTREPGTRRRASLFEHHQRLAIRGEPLNRRTTAPDR